MSGDADPSRAYWPQLDGLRAIAVTLVLVSHYGLLGALPVPNVGFLMGAVGVDLFFVLSGFLISGILLEGRARVESGRATLGGTIRRFYARRFLRIFPIYYATLAALALAGVPAVRENALWFLSYTANFKMALDGSNLHPAGHFWSLAVEEQFYLVWPAVVLWAGRQRFVPAMAMAWAVSIAVRIVVWERGGDNFAIRMNTLACLDYFAAGALLAIHRLEPARLRGLVRALHVLGPWVGLPVAIVLMVTDTFPYERYSAFAPLAVVPLAAWLVDRSWRGPADALGSLLASRPLRAVGRISYGMYVYHLPVSFAAGVLAARLGWPAPEYGWRSGVPLFAVTVAVAALSWRCFEAPINDLKRHFRDPPANGATPRAA